jgi:predicted nuclease with TOPRIM domain
VSEEPFNLVLAMLRDIRARQNEHSADLVEIKERLGLLEGGQASLSRRVDRIAGDVEHIKRRLELTDAPT